MLLGSWTTTLITSNKKTEGIMKIVKSLAYSGLWLTGVSETIQKKAKNKKEDFLVCYQIHYVVVYKYVNRQTNYKSRIWSWGVFDQKY